MRTFIEGAGRMRWERVEFYDRRMGRGRHIPLGFVAVKGIFNRAMIGAEIDDEYLQTIFFADVRKPQFPALAYGRGRLAENLLAVVQSFQQDTIDGTHIGAGG